MTVSMPIETRLLLQQLDSSARGDLVLRQYEDDCGGVHSDVDVDRLRDMTKEAAALIRGLYARLSAGTPPGGNGPMPRDHRIEAEAELLDHLRGGDSLRREGANWLLIRTELQVDAALVERLMRPAPELRGRGGLVPLGDQLPCFDVRHSQSWAWAEPGRAA